MDTELLKRHLHVLHLEDNAHDHQLVVELLREDGLQCEFTLAMCQADFLEALRRCKYDLVISDFSLPSYDGLSALTAAQERYPEIPFIFFSGTIGEDVAVESLKHGAVDYVLKQRSSRLTAAVRRALRNAGELARLKSAERALRESEERFRIVARATNDVVWEWDIQNKRVWLSSNFETAFGHPIANEWIASDDWMNLIHPADKTQVIARLASSLANGGRIWQSDHRLRRADGSYAFIYDRASITYDASGKPQRMVGVKMDMSERKLAEEKIQQQAELLDRAQDAIIVCTLDREIVFWNQGAERIYGWTATEAFGKNIHQLLFGEVIPPHALEAAQKTDESGEWMGELTQRTKSGRDIMLHTRSTLVRNDQGQPKSVLIINTDITAHKQLEEQFLRAQRLDSLGALVSGIAHDMNNSLVPIILGVEVLKTEPLAGDSLNMLLTMETSARRCAEMIKQMLLFARGGEVRKILIHPDHLVKEMSKLITDTFPKTVRCRLRLEEPLHLISAIPTQIHQVLMNLCVNARDAMNNRGELTLAAENIIWKHDGPAQPAGARAGDYVCIRLQDTGAGIPAEHLEKIFQPFFTTKAPGKGTGLGLSTCQSIIQNHQGFIAVESKVGIGTEFKIYLPAAGIESAAATAVKTSAPPGGKGERILVVDDEESILALTRATLENYGYQVFTAVSGLEAVSQFRETPDNIQIVLADYSMPFMDAKTLIAALRKIRPNVKIILASATEGELESLAISLGVTDFVPKPFATEDLLRVIHKSLN